MWSDQGYCGQKVAQRNVYFVLPRSCFQMTCIFKNPKNIGKFNWKFNGKSNLIRTFRNSKFILEIHSRNSFEIQTYFEIRTSFEINSKLELKIRNSFQIGTFKIRNSLEIRTYFEMEFILDIHSKLELQ